MVSSVHVDKNNLKVRIELCEDIFVCSIFCMMIILSIFAIIAQRESLLEVAVEENDIEKALYAVPEVVRNDQRKNWPLLSMVSQVYAHYVVFSF